MSFLKKYGRILLFDTLALLCFIGVIMFGWLPGPGGVPLFLLGLSLLAANHKWAERWLETAKHKGVSFKNRLFPDKPWIRNSYDIVTILLFSAAITLLFNAPNRLIEGASTIVMTISLFTFLLNRDRFSRITTYFRRLSR
jgi:hypothetical protein